MLVWSSRGVKTVRCTVSTRNYQFQFGWGLEYLLDVDDKLSGYSDYLIRANQELIIIEAKKGDIDSGFKQLSAELIALDKYEEAPSDVLYGAVSIGEMWIFGILDRKTKRITRSMRNFTIPEDLEDIFRLLVGITE